jgi:hypothetical protein
VIAARSQALGNPCPIRTLHPPSLCHDNPIRPGRTWEDSRVASLYTSLREVGLAFNSPRQGREWRVGGSEQEEGGRGAYSAEEKDSGQGSLVRR